MTDEHLQSRLWAIEKEKAERLKSRKEYDDKKAALEADIEQMKQNELLAVNEQDVYKRQAFILPGQQAIVKHFRNIIRKHNMTA